MMVCMFICSSKQVSAAVYDDPVEFYDNYASDGEGYYDDDTGYVYFGSRGKTASSSTGTKFRTVGYRIYLNTKSGNKDLLPAEKESVPQFEVLLNGDYVKDYKEKQKTVDGVNYTYVVRRAKLNKLKTLFSKNVGDITV